MPSLCQFLNGAVAAGHSAPQFLDRSLQAFALSVRQFAMFDFQRFSHRGCSSGIRRGPGGALLRPVRAASTHRQQLRKMAAVGQHTGPSTSPTTTAAKAPGRIRTDNLPGVWRPSCSAFRATGAITDGQQSREKQAVDGARQQFAMRDGENSGDLL